MKSKILIFLLLAICHQSYSIYKFIIPINVVPNDAEIWVEGKLMGKGNITLILKEAKVINVLIQREGYVSEIVVFKYMNAVHVKRGRDKSDSKFNEGKVYSRGDNDTYQFTLIHDDKFAERTPVEVTNVDVKGKYTIGESSNPQCEIMHIGLTDSLTHIFFKYTTATSNTKNNSICIDDNIYIKSTLSEKKYKLINSLNIPICPAYQELNDSNQIHYFSLTFQPLPKNTKQIDIIENGNRYAFNFDEVSLSPNKIDSIAYLDLLEETPVKEKGEFLKDGKIVKYFIHKGFIIGLNLTIESLYGKYYTAYISIENYTKNRRDFFPERIISYVKNIDGSTQFSFVLSYEAYMKKVNKKQKNESFFYALGESISAMNTGYSASNTNTNSNGQSNSLGYFGNSNGYVSSNVRTYANVSSNSTTVNYDATANYFARQNATKNINDFNNMQYSIRKNINLGYFKANTIFSNERINGYVNIPFTKANELIIKIPLNNEVYTFEWLIK